MANKKSDYALINALAENKKTFIKMVEGQNFTRLDRSKKDFYLQLFDFENPKNRDMALKDRIKETYVNVTLCDDGCINTGIDIKNNVASCDCKFNDITNNEIIHENAASEL